MAAPGFWDNQDSAQAVVVDLKSLNVVVNPLGELISAAEDLTALVELAEEDPSIEPEVAEEISRLN